MNRLRLTSEDLRMGHADKKWWVTRFRARFAQSIRFVRSWQFSRFFGLWQIYSWSTLSWVVLCASRTSEVSAAKVGAYKEHSETPPKLTFNLIYQSQREVGGGGKGGGGREWHTAINEMFSSPPILVACQNETGWKGAMIGKTDRKVFRHERMSDAMFERKSFYNKRGEWPDLERRVGRGEGVEEAV